MIILDGKSLTLESLKSIARDDEKVGISASSKILVDKASSFVSKVSKQDLPVYGINTGFGKLSSIIIEKNQVDQLQINLLMSHACGMGEPLPCDVVRGMMALRINALVKGYSGIRLCTIEKMVEMLNSNITPVVFEKGSLGASGDLALLSHMSLPLLGLGEVFYQGERMASMNAFSKVGLRPLPKLVAKEGLSLINGTQAMNAIGSLVLYDALRLEKIASLAASLTMEALGGIVDAFDDRIHQVRGQSGQISVAKQVLDHLEGSTYVKHQGEERVQDAYSLRCVPQVHGASLDAFRHVSNIVEIEMNAVTDNPIVFESENEAINAGNFHGQPLALSFDYMGIAIAELANISERRIESLVNPALSHGLPPFLAKCSGLNSGFMIVQYTAASLVSENKVLAHPASIDSIPSSANQEDHVSMGSIAARKAASILDNARKVVALELMTAAQALDFRNKMTLGKHTEKAYQLIRQTIPFMTKDEIMYPHLHAIESLIKSDLFYQTIFEGDDLDA